MARAPRMPGALPRLRIRPQKSGTIWYYYDHGGRPRRETPLGADYGVALQRWQQLSGETDLTAAVPPNLQQLIEHYQHDVLAAHPLLQQQAVRRELQYLGRFMGAHDTSLAGALHPAIVCYLRWRCRSDPGVPLRLRGFYRWCRAKGYVGRVGGVPA